MKDTVLRLQDVMTSLSAKYFGVDWADGLEYALWHWLDEGLTLTVHERYALYQAALLAGGWLTQVEAQLVLIDLDLWELHFASGEW